MSLPSTDPRAKFKMRVEPHPCPTPAETFFVQELRVLECYVCEEQTVFQLNEERTIYSCTVCGLEIEYHIAT